MSYDVTLLNPKTKEPIPGMSWNYTWNLSKFFQKFGVHPYQHMQGKQASEVLAMIDLAFMQMARVKFEHLRVEFEPPKGEDGDIWGTVDGAIDFLLGIQQGCRAYLRAVVRAD